jgi:hypothetical protein
MWIKTEDGDLINSDNIISIYCMPNPYPNKICAKLINGDYVTIRKFNTATGTYEGINILFDGLMQGYRALDCSD